MKKYSMNEAMGVANEAYDMIHEHLIAKEETVAVINVENDKDFQKTDIDFLWVYKFNGQVVMKKIEIKGDRYSKSGNFFLETVSNDNKNTLGCFMYTEADYIFYLFIDTGELNLIPVKEAREWFIENKDRFREVSTTTTLGDFDAYNTIGSLVPKDVMRKEVMGMQYKVI